MDECFRDAAPRNAHGGATPGVRPGVRLGRGGARPGVGPRVLGDGRGGVRWPGVGWAAREVGVPAPIENTGDAEAPSSEFRGSEVPRFRGFGRRGCAHAGCRDAGMPGVARVRDAGCGVTRACGMAGWRDARDAVAEMRLPGCGGWRGCRECEGAEGVWGRCRGCRGAHGRRRMAASGRAGDLEERARRGIGGERRAEAGAVPHLSVGADSEPARGASGGVAEGPAGAAVRPQPRPPVRWSRW